MMSRPKVPPPPATPLPRSIALGDLSLVSRSDDGDELDRADGPMLAGMLSGIRDTDRRRLFDPDEIAAHVEGLAALLGAIGRDPDTPGDTSTALFVVEQSLRALVPRLEHFTDQSSPADCYTVEITPAAVSS